MPLIIGDILDADDLAMVREQYAKLIWEDGTTPANWTRLT